MEKYEVRDIVRKELDEYIEWKDCPVCNSCIPFLKYEKKVKEDEYKNFMRCAGCLTEFEVSLTPVKEESIGY